MNEADPAYAPNTSSTCCVGPLILVLTSLLVVQGYTCFTIVKQRSALNFKQINENADQAAARYKLVSDKLESLATDLTRLSLTSNEAKEIVTQFNIQINQPANPAATTPAK